MNNKTLLIVLLIIPISMCYSVGIWPSYEWIPAIIDARSMGLGHTAVISSISANSIFSNPSLLPSDKFNIQFGGRMIAGDFASEYLSNYYLKYDNSLPPHYDFNHISLSIPIKIPILKYSSSIGFGYGRHFDYGYKLEENYKTQYHSYDKDFEVSGGIDNYIIALKIHVSNTLALGLSYRWSWNNTFNSYLYSDGILYRSYVTKYFTSFITFGVNYEVKDDIIVSVAYTPSYVLNHGGYVITTHPINSREVRYPPPYRMPGELGLGIGYHFNDLFWLFFEYDWRFLSVLNYANSNKTDKWYDNGSNERIGLEIGNAVKFRTGFYANSITKTNENSTRPVKQIGVTGGLGINIFDTNIDIAVDYHKWNYFDTIYSVGYWTRYKRVRIMATITKEIPWKN